MRHALAPGYGDPVNFQLGDCSTQRNLSEAGRVQAKMIGQALADHGWTPTRILSSPWCRCLETAEHLDLGHWAVHQGLGSFFQGRVDKKDTLAALNAEIARIDESEHVLLITHHVVIQAITGKSVPSGGLVAFNPETKTSRILKLDR